MEPVKKTKANFIWNMIGSIFESALSFVLLIVVNRVLGEKHGGVFTLAFSHAQLMYYVGTLEVRPIQSTDVKKTHSFSEYFSLRIASCALMVLVCLIYVLMMNEEPVKRRIIMFVCLYKTIEAVIDVFTAMYQQNDRIEFSGKISVVRVSLTLVFFVSSILITHSLEIAALLMIVAALVTLLTYNGFVFRKFSDAHIRLYFSKTKEILISCFPLFISVFVMLYISNAPKYAINKYCNDVVQNRYSILFMPAFAINLLSLFILRPLLTTMAKLWTDGEIKAFIRNVLRMMMGLLVITGMGMFCAWLMGIPILNRLYHLELRQDKPILLLVMIYGGLNAVNIFLYDMIAVARKQKWMLLGYISAAFVIVILAPVMVQKYEMWGAIISSICAILLLDIVLGLILFMEIRQRKKTLRRKV